MYRMCGSPKLFHARPSSSPWNSAGQTLSDKNAMKEYPALTQEIIYKALNDGKLQGTLYLLLVNQIFFFAED